MAAIRHKRSNTSGHRTNLVPGQVAHNRADDVLLIRGGARKLEINLEQWREKSLPPPGVVGAPLAISAGAPVWDASLLPAGAINGVVPVDQAPVEGAWSVPGTWQRLAAGATLTTSLSAHDAIIERFFVASDAVRVQAVGFKLTDVSYVGTIRVAIVEESTGNTLFDRLFSGPWTGVQSATVALSLPRGYYKKVIWVSADGASVQHWTTARYNSSFEITGGELTFPQYQATNYDFTSGVTLDPEDPPLVIEDVRSVAPEEEHHVFLKWRLTSFEYEPETIDLIDRMTDKPDRPTRQIIDRLIQDLKNAGVWPKFDALYVTAAHAEQPARLNWVGADSLAGALVFLPHRGFTTNQGSTAKLTGSIPSRVTTASYHAGAWEIDYEGRDIAATGAQHAVLNVMANAWIFPGDQNSDLITNDFLPSAAGTHTAASGGNGHAVIGRAPGADPYTVYKDGAVKARGRLLSAGGAVASGTASILQQCGAGTLAIAHYGQGLTDDEVLAVYTAFQRYLDAVGALIARTPLKVTAAPTTADIVDAGTAADAAILTVIGGSGAYTYQWSAPSSVTLSSPTAPAPVVSTDLSAGQVVTTQATVRVTDTATGETWDLSVPIKLTSLTGSAAPATVLGTRTTAGLVTSTAATATGVGGYGAYTYQWTPPAGMTATTPNAAATTFSQALTFGASASGVATCVITDVVTLLTKTVSVNVQLSVFNPLSASTTPGTVSGSRTGAGTASSTAATGSASGGSGDYTLTWIAPAGMTASNPSSATTSFSKVLANGATASGTATFRVTDNLTGQVATATVAVNLTSTFLPPLNGAISPSTVNVTATPSSGPLSAHFVMNATGGLGNRTYNWQITNITGGSATLTGGQGTTAADFTYYKNSVEGGSPAVTISCTVHDVDTGETITRFCTIDTTGFTPPPPPPPPPTVNVQVSPNGGTVFGAAFAPYTVCFSGSAAYNPPYSGGNFVFLWDGSESGSPCSTATLGAPGSAFVFFKGLSVFEFGGPGGSGGALGQLRVIAV